MNRLRQRLFVRALEDRTAPATFTVMNLNNSGVDSLRDCVSKANAAAGADNVTFNSSLSGTITLTSEIAITEQVNLVGTGKVTLSGGDSVRILNITSVAAGTLVLLSDLTLTKGRTDGIVFGGAILSDDQALEAHRCTFSSNFAGVGGAVKLAQGGSFAAIDCTFSGNTTPTTPSSGTGGAISMSGNTSKLVVDGCTFTGNSALHGGAIFATASLQVTDSTFFGNAATTGVGGAIQAFGTFAAGKLRVINSTITGNTAGTGASSTGDGGGIGLREVTGTLELFNSTVTTNSAKVSGGGIARTGSTTPSITIESSIVYGNICAASPDISSSGTVNLKTSAVGSSTGFTMTNLGGNLAFGTNLKLGPLQNNGGLTLTHLPAGDSPLVDVGSNSAALTNDQRGTGFPRLSGGNVDIGATELLNLTVSNTNDSGAGSLRQAVQQANAHPGADTVTFDAAVFPFNKTITLTTGELSITESIAILGPANRVTINGNSASRAFKVLTGAGTNVPILFEKLNLTNCVSGSVGGAIAIDDEALTLRNCNITNSKANSRGSAIDVGSAALAPGSLVLEDCSLTGNTASSGSSGNGGAIFTGNEIPVTIRRSTISGNVAGGSGGGLYFFDDGSLIVEDSTLSGNTANTTLSGLGGGAIQFRGTATQFQFTNSTLSGNAAPMASGGAVCLESFSGSVTLANCTITNNSAAINGGGIARTSGASNFTLSSTIVAGNANTNAADLFFNKSTGVDGNNNLIGVVDVGNFNLTGTSNLTGTKATPLVAKLGPLASNGGPTQTHALLSSSPAINAGNNAALLTSDQRGASFPRVFGAAADIGALETHPATYTVLNANSTGAGSLSKAIIDANAKVGHDTILFDATVFASPQVILLNGAEITITDEVTIVGLLGKITISGNNASRIFNIAPAAVGGTVAMSGLTLTSGKAAAGGAIQTQNAVLSLTDCSIIGNVSTESGGGIDTQGPLHINNCTISSNTAPGDGGGIYAHGTFAAGDLVILNSVFLGNSANTAGGAINLGSFTGTMEMKNCNLVGNTAKAFGGAIADRFSANASASLTSCNLQSNRAVNSDGGAVSLRSLVADRCTFTQNNAGAWGGAIYGSILTLQTCSVVDNDSVDSGGGIYTNGGIVLIVDSTIAQNTSSNDAHFGIGGGGIAISGSLTANSRIVNSTLAGNNASGLDGSAIFVTGTPFPLELQNCTITGNSSGDGVVVGQSSGSFTLESTIVAQNFSSGMDVYIRFGTNVAITSNHSLVGRLDASNCFLAGTQNSNGSGASPLNAKLSFLTNNGGPTMTVALLPGSPAINAGRNLAGLTNDQRGVGFARSVGQTDIGAFEVQTVPAKVTSVQINDGSVQRSRVTSLLVTFDQPPVFVGSPAAGFQLKRQSDNAAVTLNAVPSGNTVTLTFTGGVPFEFGSLADGRYTLTALASQITNLDGDSNGSVGGDFILASAAAPNPPTNIFRFFGDATGDGNVAIDDFDLFIPAFGGFAFAFDFDGDGSVAINDFDAFRNQFGGSI